MASNYRRYLARLGQSSLPGLRSLPVLRRRGGAGDRGELNRWSVLHYAISSTPATLRLCLAVLTVLGWVMHGHL